MKKLLFSIIAALFIAVPAVAQNLNSNPDSIVGEYSTDRGGSKSKDVKYWIRIQ